MTVTTFTHMTFCTMNHNYGAEVSKNCRLRWGVNFGNIYNTLVFVSCKSSEESKCSKI